MSPARYDASTNVRSIASEIAMKNSFPASTVHTGNPRAHTRISSNPHRFGWNDVSVNRVRIVYPPRNRTFQSELSRFVLNATHPVIAELRTMRRRASNRLSITRAVNADEIVNARGRLGIVVKSDARINGFSSTNTSSNDSSPTFAFTVQKYATSNASNCVVRVRETKSPSFPVRTKVRVRIVDVIAYSCDSIRDEERITTKVSREYSSNSVGIPRPPWIAKRIMSESPVPKVPVVAVRIRSGITISGACVNSTNPIIPPRANDL